jgi:hypothetical protein
MVGRDDRTMRSLIRVAFIALAFAALPSRAMYHLWVMNEVYSDADGTVQFLEMTATAGQQQFLQGHSLVSRTGGTSLTFSFPTDLPGETTGARMLIATEGFAALGVVAPDYIVPNGFFPRGGGSIDFAGVDIWSFGALPADGRSLIRDGTTAINSPLNFSGRTGTVPVSAPLSFQGLWWRAPAGSESGWGLAIAHEGDVVFGAWFTYDADNRPLWLVAPEARRTSGNSFAGRLYRTTGPAFGAVPWLPASVTVIEAGNATFAFSDADNGTFTYTVGMTTQSKAISRQRLGG